MASADDLGILDAYRRVLAFRFADVVRAIEATAPDVAGSTGLSTAWKTIARLPLGWLDNAVDQPELAEWVRTGEKLLDVGVYERHPWAHPSRHAEELSRLLLGWAHLTPEGTSGTACGRGTIVRLCFGTLVLRSTEVRPTFPLRWRRERDGVRVETPGAEAFVPVSDPARATVRGAWQGHLLPSVDGVLVDVWTGTLRADVVAERELRDTLAGMAEHARQRGGALSTWLRRVTLQLPVADPLPGTLDVADPRQLTTALVASSEVADLAARAEILAGWVARAIDWTEPEATLQLEASLADAGIDPGIVPRAGRTLRKPRAVERREIEWSTVDAISTIAPGMLVHLAEMSPDPGSEAGCFVAAVAAYSLGRWREAVTWLRACLNHDPAAEPYLLLLAFTLRQMGDRRASETILFEEGVP